MADNEVAYGITVIADEATEQLDLLADSVDNASGNFSDLAEEAESSMERLSDAAESGSSSVDSLASSAAKGGGGLRQISAVVSMFSPALGKMVAGISKAIMAVKGLSAVMSVLNKKMIILTAVIAAVGVAYSLLNGDTEEQKAAAEEAARAEERLKTAMDNLVVSTENLARARNMLRRANGSVAQSTEDLKNEIKLLTINDENSRKELERQINRKKQLRRFTDQLAAAKQTEAEASKANTENLKAEKAVQEERLKTLEKQAKQELKRKTVKVSGDTGFAPARFESQPGQLSDATAKAFLQAKQNVKDLDAAILKSSHTTQKLLTQSKDLEAGNFKQNQQAEEYNRLLKSRDALLKRRKRLDEAARKNEAANNTRRTKAQNRSNEITANAQERERNRLAAINKLLSIRTSIEQVNKSIALNALAINDKARTAEEKLLQQEIKINELMAKRLKGKEREAALANIERMQSALDEKSKLRQNEQRDAALQKDKDLVAQQKKNKEEAEKQLDILKKNKATTEEITAANKQLQRATDGVTNALQTQADNIKRYDAGVSAQRQTNTREEILTNEERTAEQIKSIEGLDNALKSLNAEYAASTKVNPYAQLDNSLDDIRSQIKSIRKEGVIPDVETQLKKLEEGLKAFESQARTEIKATVVVDKIQGALDILNDSLRALGDPAGMVSGVATGIGAALGGPAGAALGQTFGSLVQGLSALGEKDPAELEAEMMQFTQAFIKGLQVLPKILIKLLPKLITGLSIAIISAIPILLVELVKAIGEILTGAFDALSLKDGEGFFEYIGRQITQIFDFWANFLFGGSDEGMRSGGSARPLSGRSGMRMTRGTGLALLHPNEFVVPQSGMAPQAVTRTLDSIGSGSNATNININSIVTERSAIDELVNRIEQRYQLFGQSRSTLFAG